MSFRDLDSLLGSEEPKEQRRSRPIILVVDDDDDLRMALVLCLQAEYEVRACPSAAAALEALGPEVRAVVLDVMMPGRDGLWTHGEIRRSYPSLPVIFFSAYDPVHVEREMDVLRQPFGFISKGCDSEEILDAVRRAVAHAEALASKSSA